MNIDQKPLKDPTSHKPKKKDGTYLENVGRHKESCFDVRSGRNVTKPCSVRSGVERELADQEPEYGMQASMQRKRGRKKEGCSYTMVRKIGSWLSICNACLLGGRGGNEVSFH